jgi:hypothetical protein
MRNLLIGASLFIAAAISAPAAAQQSALKPGPFWQAAEIYVQDGQTQKYADWLATTLDVKPGVCEVAGVVVGVSHPA